MQQMSDCDRTSGNASFSQAGPGRSQEGADGLGE